MGRAAARLDRIDLAPAAAHPARADHVRQRLSAAAHIERAGGAEHQSLRAPQPETVRDYKITAGGRTLAEVKGNFQRINRHRFEAVETKSIRMEIEATNGDRQAKIFEIRCYA